MQRFDLGVGESVTVTGITKPIRVSAVAAEVGDADHLLIGPLADYPVFHLVQEALTG